MLTFFFIFQREWTSENYYNFYGRRLNLLFETALFNKDPETEKVFFFKQKKKQLCFLSNDNYYI